MVLKVATTPAGLKTLVLDTELLQTLSAQDADEFEVTRNGDVIELRPMQPGRQEHVRAVTEKIMSQHDDTFRKLSQ